MKNAKMSGRRPGTTLIETLVALTLLGVLITMTLSMLDQQMRAFNAGTTQTDAVQTLRYTMSVFEKDLATVGTNIGQNQPHLVFADTHVVSFNADYTSRNANDPFAVFVDTASPVNYSSAVTVARQFLIPRTTYRYPDVTYLSGGTPSLAETITFYFEPDTTTTRTDDYVLQRKVNDQPADMIARGVLKVTGLPFFEYWRKMMPWSAAEYIEQVPAAQLPLWHKVVVAGAIVPNLAGGLHAAAYDTSFYSRIDSIRGIKVNFRVTDNKPGATERIFRSQRTIWFANAGTQVKKTCGDAPLPWATAFTATNVTVSGVKGVRLNWNRATDESSGERDVIRYVIYREGAAGPVSDPFLSLPSAGTATYTYTDFNVTPLQPYYYSLAAQDCTPQLSPITSLPVVIVP